MCEQRSHSTRRVLFPNCIKFFCTTLSVELSIPVECGGVLIQENREKLFDAGKSCTTRGCAIHNRLYSPTTPGQLAMKRKSEDNVKPRPIQPFSAMKRRSQGNIKPGETQQEKSIFHRESRIFFWFSKWKTL